MSDATAKKEERRKFQAIRGVRDLLPPETELWTRVEQTSHEVFSTFGYGEIRLPIFEQTDLFARAVGGETDIVSKEMYTFEDYELPELGRLRSMLATRRLFFDDFQSLAWHKKQTRDLLEGVKIGLEAKLIPRIPENEAFIRDILTLLDAIPSPPKRLDESGLKEFKKLFDLRVDAVRQSIGAVKLGDDISLRPEATASVCRAYIEHNMQQMAQPVKLYYMGPMFRRERPQKGRYRQFYQIGAEVLGGTDAPAIDAEVIEMVMTFFERLGLQGVQLDINSIGDKNCRPKYVELLRAELLKVKDRLGPDSQRRIETNPLRVLDSKVKEEQSVIETLPRIGDHLCKDCALHYADVKHELELRGVKYCENWRLVRGLDYYMRTTFEITAKGLGAQNAVCGGGRYDGLVELLGGPQTKGIGFAIGEDRLVLSLQESGLRRSS